MLSGAISQLSLSLTIDFAKYFGHVCACGVAFEEVSCVVFGACSAASADFAVLADSALALNVAFVS